MMVEQKSISTKRKNGKNLGQIKPSRYIDMVSDALQSLENKGGSIPKKIAGYISKTYNMENDNKTIFNGVYRALRQGIKMDLFQKNTYGRFKLTARTGKGEKIPGRKRRKKGRKRGRKKRKGRKRRKRRKGRKKAKRRKSRRRRKKSRKRRRWLDDQEEPRKRRRKHDDHDEPKKRRRKQHEEPEEPRRRRRRADDQDEPKKRRPRKKDNE